MNLRLTLLALLLCVRALAAGEKPVTVVVFPFNSNEKKGDWHSQLITDSLTAQLANDPRLAVVERANLSKVLSEQAMGLSGEIDPETAAKIGRLTGAKVLIMGRRFGNDRAHPDDLEIVIVRVIGVETGRILSQTVQAENPGRGAVAKIGLDLAGKIGDLIFAHLADLMGTSLTQDQRIDLIVKSVAGPKRPAIAVRIKELRGGRTPVVSTVETELGLIFGRAGFPLIDDESGGKPAIEISGQVIGEQGPSQGNLSAGQATLEVKVRDRASGKILLVDRESGEGLKVGAQTALNAALESASDALAAKLVPLLSQ